MKRLVVLLGLVALCVSADDLDEILKNPGDNSHFVEGKSRYVWMPNGEGTPVLVDLHEPVDEELLNSRNGANNQYWLFTRRNPNNRQIITNGNAGTIWASHYLGSRPTKVIIHGWNNNGNSHVNTAITAAFLAQSDCNVIVVDWHRLSNSNYNTAVAGVPSVGQHAGNFIMWLINTAGGIWNNVHFVGHSLGAHAVGNAGRATGRRVRRVTGLDPARPQWIGNPNALSNNAGGHVEVIHTDGRLLGIMNPSGHADFYPNGGMNPQPGCALSTCSHGRAVDLFAASVRFNRFVGRRCISIHEAELSRCTGAAMNMGNNIMSKSGSGLYGLRTGSSWPF